MPARGTQFVSVRKYENRTTGDRWPADERAIFENLTDAQREVFFRAFEDG